MARRAGVMGAVLTSHEDHHKSHHEGPIAAAHVQVGIRYDCPKLTEHLGHNQPPLLAYPRS